MTTVTLYIPVIKHGAIMGSGGVNIKAIQTDFSVSVRVPRKDQNSPLVTLSGQEADIGRAVTRIQELISIEVDTIPFETKLVSIPSIKHGILIGKGGETLKELQRKSRAIIEIPKKESGTEITVIGTKAAVERALKEISLILTPQGADGSAPIPLSLRQSQAASKEVPIQRLSFDKDINEALFFEGEDPAVDASTFDRLLLYLRSVTHSMDVCVFTITDDDIYRVLLESHRLGVRVRIISDDEQSETTGSDIQKLANEGLSVRLDRSKSHMHHKFAVLDGKVLINGSFNFTRAGHTQNRENVMITSSRNFVSAFSVEFEKLWISFAPNSVLVKK